MAGTHKQNKCVKAKHDLPSDSNAIHKLRAMLLGSSKSSLIHSNITNEKNIEHK